MKTKKKIEPIDIRIKESGDRADIIRKVLESKMSIGKHKTLSVAAAAIILEHSDLMDIS